MDLSTIVAVLVPLSFLIYWLIDLEKDITNKNLSGVVTKLSAYVASYVVISLYAHSSINLGAAGDARAALANLGWQDVALLAMVGAATGGSFSDYLRARNTADTTVKPTLLPSESATNQAA